MYLVQFDDGTTTFLFPDEIIARQARAKRYNDALAAVVAAEPSPVEYAGPKLKSQTATLNVIAKNARLTGERRSRTTLASPRQTTSTPTSSTGRA